MSAEAIVALFGAGIALMVAVQGFMWRAVEKQIGAIGKRIDSLKTDLEGQIGALRTDLEGQIGALRTDLEGQIGAMGKRIDSLKTDLEGQIRTLKTDLEGQIANLAQRIADSEARSEKAHARIENNIRETEVRLTGRIEEQTKRIDALHRDMLGLGERVAVVEARA